MSTEIQDEIMKIHSLGMLNALLADKTTKENILWATDAYQDKGAEYQRNKEIKPELITGTNAKVIKNRAEKELDQCSERIRKHAEVFTPLWICRQMIHYADQAWFGKTDALFQEGQMKKPVLFSTEKSWKQYVDSRRLEITCGEAPYLVNRYDALTGKGISIEKRKGILDRKLRVVNEHAADEEEWLTWALRAFQSTYGYEFQGDNLLISRVNLLMTFEEYLYERWKRKPTKREYRIIIKTIAWNIWQMDGLTGTIPYCKAQEEFHQMSLFEWYESSEYHEQVKRQPHCRIYDWRRDNSLEYLNMNKGGRNMRFDFVIGNPPYQEEQEGDNKTFAPPVYHKFLENSYKIADAVEMIHPARFLFNAGNTPKEWNKQMLNDPNLKVLWFEQNSGKVFANTDIKGGVAITYHDRRKNFGRIGTFTAFTELNFIMKKVEPYTTQHNLTDMMYNQVNFNLDTLLSEHPECKTAIGSNGRDRRFEKNMFVKLPLFTEEKINSDDIRVLGVIKNKRVWRYIPLKYVDTSHENLFKYKVLIPRSNGSGAIGEVLSTPLIGEPLIGYTRTFIAAGSFDSQEEAESALKYVKSKFARTMLGILKITQDNPIDTWRYVPLQDFTSSSDIDWSKSVAEIDRQLYAKYGLDEKEIEFIETHVKEMA